MTKSERIPALFFLLFSLFVCQQSVVIGVGSLSQPGPGLLAFGAGAGVGLFALWFLIQSMAAKGQTRTGGRSAVHRKGNFFLICLSLFGYTFAAKWLGFILSTFLFTIFIFSMIESKKWWRVLIEAALITIGNYLFFAEWLDLSLPKGFFGW
jgi:hypothetical protein